MSRNQRVRGVENFQAIQKLRCVGRQSTTRPTKKVSGTAAQTVRREAVEHHFATAQDMRHEHAGDGDRKPSVRTICRILSPECGLRSAGPAKKLLISATQRLSRAAWCKLHEDCTEEDWAAVMWSGECTYRQFSPEKQKLSLYEPFSIRKLMDAMGTC
jgi:hypothetical protein